MEVDALDEVVGGDGLLVVRRQVDGTGDRERVTDQPRRDRDHPLHRRRPPLLRIELLAVARGGGEVGVEIGVAKRPVVDELGEPVVDGGDGDALGAVLVGGVQEIDILDLQGAEAATMQGEEAVVADEPPRWSQLGRVHHLQQVVGRRSHPQQRRQQRNNIRQFVKQLADLWELRLQRVKQALNLRIDCACRRAATGPLAQRWW